MLIAHRLSTVRNADSIVVLDGGTVVEQVRTHGVAWPLWLVRAGVSEAIWWHTRSLCCAVPWHGMVWHGPQGFAVATARRLRADGSVGVGARGREGPQLWP